MASTKGGDDVTGSVISAHCALTSGGVPLSVPGTRTTAARWEAFLLTTNVASSSGITFSVNRPTKYVSNPVFGSSGWTWDRDIDHATVWTDPSWPSASRYRMLYAGINAAVDTYSLCYAHSADGLSWTKPTVGRISYGGNTTNNIVLTGLGVGLYNMPAVTGIPAIAGQEWLLSLNSLAPTDTQNHNLIYGASAPEGPYTLLSNIGTLTGIAALGMAQRADGLWIVYYEFGNVANKREIGAWLSSSRDLSVATWTDQGTVINGAVTATTQHTFTLPQRHGGLIYVWESQYDGTALQYHPIQPWVSVETDGLSFTRMDTSWLDLGGGGAWDGVGVSSGAPVQVGTEWWHYYVGQTAITSASRPWNQYVGVAKIGYNRIGVITGAGGTLTTTALCAPDAHLYLNCDGSAGGASIAVELIDAVSGAVLAGYAHTDCDAITANSISVEVTWGSGARKLPAGVSLQLKLYLTGGAVVYAYYCGVL